MNFPPGFLEQLTGTAGFSKDAFAAAHTSGLSVTSVRLNPLKPLPVFPPSSLKISGGILSDLTISPIPWCDTGYYLSERPSFTFDPLFHAGTYYVQEASSMFLEQAMKQSVDLSAPLKVLDLCAAPGGKSTHLQSLISKESVLVSNEVIRARSFILRDNIIKWGGDNVVVTNNDPKDFARLEHYFDVVVADAPCSGSGLFRKEPEAMEEWSENNVQLCSQRQQRILADVLPALKNGGILIYSTCSYSKEEDEEICHWLSAEHGMQPVQLSVPMEWGIIESGDGYRFWPDRVKGEGFFLACFQKTVGQEKYHGKTAKQLSQAGQQIRAAVKPWIATEGKQLLLHESTVYAWPEKWVEDFHLFLDKLRVVYSGVRVGELIREKLIPDHALAMSTCMANDVLSSALQLDQAIAYLQKKEFSLETGQKGWQLAVYDQLPLGWINVLPNRFNNYYPKELRILKEK